MKKNVDWKDFYKHIGFEETKKTLCNKNEAQSFSEMLEDYLPITSKTVISKDNINEKYEKKTFSRKNFKKNKNHYKSIRYNHHTLPQLDLHGYSLEEAKVKCREFLNQLLHANIEKCLIITGIGKHSLGYPVLKNQIPLYLQNLNSVKNFHTHKNNGAFLIYLNL